MAVIASILYEKSICFLGKVVIAMKRIILKLGAVNNDLNCFLNVVYF